MKKVKAELHKLCIRNVKQKIDLMKGTIKNTRESANSDTKSSMGDKYETGRAMAQLEIEKSLKQLSEAESELAKLSRLSSVSVSDTIGNGSLVMTSSGNYYIAVSVGLLHIQGRSYFVISLQSPIGQLMKGLRKSENFSLNNKIISILGVY